MLRAAVLILPVDVMASRQGSRGCCVSIARNLPLPSGAASIEAA